MSILGTIVNGAVVFDGSPKLPEGIRVRVELEDDDDIGAPPEPYDREEVLASLRESFADAKAGRGRPIGEVMEEIANEFKTGRFGHSQISSQTP